VTPSTRTLSRPVIRPNGLTWYVDYDDDYLLITHYLY